MKTWNIIQDHHEYEIEVGPITVLKGSHPLWFNVVRLIEDFFINKYSAVNIFEDTQLLNKKDWDCLFIPFDTHMQFEKLNAKSPLKSIIEEGSNELALSPAYKEMLGIWEELVEEIQFYNTKIEKYGISLDLQPLGQETLKSNISIKMNKKWADPLYFKKLLMNLYTRKPIDKKQLILIELPELYSRLDELTEFTNQINNLAKKGFQFIIVTTESSLSGSKNFVFQNKIMNRAKIEGLKRKIIKELPFVCGLTQYDETVNLLLRAVDNLENDNDLTALNVIGDVEKIIVYLISKYLDVYLNLDFTGVSTNINEFLKSY